MILEVVNKNINTKVMIKSMKKSVIVTALALITNIHVIAQSSLSEEVSFNNENIKLSGTLYLPDNISKPVPTLIALHPSGPGERENVIFEHLIDDLPQKGIAVFVYDRRGSGESGGNLQFSDYYNLAEDAVSAKKALSEIEKIDGDKIGFWGLSQGGWLAPLAATIAENAAFSISVVGAGVTPSEQMLYYSINNLSNEGFSEEDIGEMSDLWADFEDFMAGKKSYEEIRSIVKTVDDKPWLDMILIPDSESIPEDPRKTGWYTEYSYDPVATISDLQAPAIYIFGGNDDLIPVEKSISRLRKYSDQNQEISWYIINQGNHVISRGDIPQEPEKLKPLDIEEYHFILHAWLENVLSR